MPKYIWLSRAGPASRCACCRKIRYDRRAVEFDQAMYRVFKLAVHPTYLPIYLSIYLLESEPRYMMVVFYERESPSPSQPSVDIDQQERGSVECSFVLCWLLLLLHRIIKSLPARHDIDLTTTATATSTTTTARIGCGHDIVVDRGRQRCVQATEQEADDTPWHTVQRSTSANSRSYADNHRPGTTIHHRRG